MVIFEKTYNIFIDRYSKDNGFTIVSSFICRYDKIAITNSERRGHGLNNLKYFVMAVAGNLSYLILGQKYINHTYIKYNGLSINIITKALMSRLTPL
jgi:hypothetical protein